jgi:hypothetical protein
MCTHDGWDGSTSTMPGYKTDTVALRVVSTSDSLSSEEAMPKNVKVV